jgi:UDP-N-acetylglucosamine--N-acetylmuramyl-(pentapeptide) pyrophosphoryl-undecaprenol N-acetylglucosamine transferase
MSVQGSAKILIVAGGTGGHLYPGIAIGRALRTSAVPEGFESWDVRFVVRRGDLGKLVLEREGFSVLEIEGQGLPRSFSLRWFSFPFKLLMGWIQAFRLLCEETPQAVIGMGGYLSFPVLATARLRGIFTLIHEQNVLPGLANRLLSRIVRSVALSFPESRSYFPGAKSWVAGLPIRDEIGHVERAAGRQALHLAGVDPVVLVFGGSQGAQRLNQVVVEAFEQLWKQGIRFQVLHIAGERHFEAVDKLYARLSFPHRIMAYCHQMADAYAAASVVISRSGASTIAELQAAGRAAILIPFPFASGNHQFFNAQILERSGLAEIILQENLSSSMLAERLALKIKSSQADAVVVGVLSDSAAAQRIAGYIRERIYE